MITDKIKNLLSVNTKMFLMGMWPNLYKFLKILEAKLLGIRVKKPNLQLPNYYLVKSALSPEDTVVDVGCGYDADFSFYMIKRHGLHAIGIDPTLKHQKSLAELAEKSDKKFSHQMWAVSNFAGKIKFNESVTSVSGSIMKEHINIKDKKTVEYEVESVTLKELPAKLNLTKIKYLKLDIEGAEYELIKNLKQSDLEKYDEIFIEFHHHALPQYSKQDTLAMATKIKNFGFRAFTLDNHDFLFYR